MQTAGSGSRIEAGPLRDAVRQSESLRMALLRYVHVYSTQVAQTSVTCAFGHVDVRLARWLLMCHDRVDGNELTMTHKVMALMLGVRRSGVTDAIHILEGRKLIRAARGTIVIRDRRGLEKAAGATYGMAEAEYERVIGIPIKPLPPVRI